MGIESILVIIIIGAIAGWLAGQVIRGFGFGLLGNIVVGILGAFVAGLIFPVIGLGFGGGILGSIVHATLGAVILLFLIRLVKRV
ncbi:GlsB/YeaQ/YmgE family stress response membrane protein [Yoonia algicola]|uniref:GlsB/YeaQ/YmgE family stress response membrane protein n=1 Tax=Yoonia algicola TaxID=3137368 RepID=A0AAN0M2V1_9RHOB